MKSFFTYENAALHGELMKYKIRKNSIVFSKEVARKRRKEGCELIYHITELEKRLFSNWSESFHIKWNEAQNEPCHLH